MIMLNVSRTKGLLVFILLILISALAYSDENINLNQKDLNIKIYDANKKNLICVKNDCISTNEILNNSLQAQTINSIQGILSNPNYKSESDSKDLLITIFKIINVSVNNKNYILLITKANQYDIPKNKITDDCHACNAQFGLIVYQYENKWLEISKNLFISKNIGEFGDFYFDNNAIQLNETNDQNMILAIRDTGGGMGETADFLTIILIKLNSAGNLESENQINQIGYIKIGESDCGSIAPKSDTTSSYFFDNSISPPNLILNKVTKDCNDKILNEEKNILYSYDSILNEYKNTNLNSNETTKSFNDEESTTNFKNAFDNFLYKVKAMLFLLVIASIVFYFIPTIVAYINEQDNTASIFILNLLAGWTFVGWVVALVWAFKKNQNIQIVNTIKSTEEKNIKRYKQDTETPVQSSFSEKLGQKDLSNDAYKIYLVEKFKITKNEVLNKYICNNKLFETVEEALQEADIAEKI